MGYTRSVRGIKMTEYYKKRERSLFEKLRKKQKIVLDWLRKTEAPKEVIEAFHESKQTKVFMI